MSRTWSAYWCGTCAKQKAKNAAEDLAEDVLYRCPLGRACLSRLQWEMFYSLPLLYYQEQIDFHCDS
ncbi:MAG: hypothetical protein CM1200mP30_14290 [Pseudomonadota bacterium]|nr:MAG: hypothetical protein CM1200mP30_14290 [Pseudomonadota bacterium]